MVRVESIYTVSCFLLTFLISGSVRSDKEAPRRHRSEKTELLMTGHFPTLTRIDDSGMKIDGQ